MHSGFLHRRLPLVFGSMIFGCLGVLVSVNTSQSQDAKVAAPPASGIFTASAAGCIECHKQKSEADLKDNDFVVKYKSTSFINFNESSIWRESDPHSKAYSAIVPANNPVAKRMEELLGVKVTEDIRCLSCHASDKRSMLPGPRKLEDYVRDTSAGVGCTVCHGTNTAWHVEHYIGTDDGTTASIPWRNYTPDVKLGKGMFNVRDPLVKAELCVSCHVGNPDEGKIVTHEFYAAGHPPLPPIELVSYMQNEPRHWGYPSELPYLVNLAKTKPDDAKKLFSFRPESEDDYLLRHMAIGAFAALKAEVKLLKHEAEKADGSGMDYARFDCYACHHDLKLPSERQKRGYPNRAPGRPPLKAWVTALPGVLTQSLDLKTGPEFMPTWMATEKAATSRPFGDAEQVKAASAQMLAWCDTTTNSIAASDFTINPALRTKMLATLGATLTTDKWGGDTEAVMNMYWAYRALATPTQQKELDSLASVIPSHVRFGAELEKGKYVNRAVPAGDVIKLRSQLFANFDQQKFNTAFSNVIGGSK